VGPSANLCRESIHAADLGVPRPTSRLTALTDLLDSGRPLVAQANLVTHGRLPPQAQGHCTDSGTCEGWPQHYYDSFTDGTYSRMAACGAEAARRHRRQRIPLRRLDEANDYA
jgi:hypothetical protein